MVHLTYKKQVLYKLEEREGVDALPTGVDALEAIDTTSPIARGSAERRVARSSLSRGRSTRGRQSSSPTFALDLRGRGTKTKPELSAPLRSSGMRELPVYLFTVASTALLTLGDTVEQQINAAPVQNARARVCEITSATTFKAGLLSQYAFVTGGGDPVTNLLNLGTFSQSLSAYALALGHLYVPDSKRALYVPLTGLLAGLASPTGDYDGEGVRFDRSGVQVAAGTIRRYDHTAATKVLYVDTAHGHPIAGDLLITSSGWTGIVAGVPTWASGWNPPGTLYVNTDGFLKRTIGSRLTHSVKGQVGETGRVDFSLMGKVGTSGDSVFVGNPSYPSDAAPITIMGTLFTVDGLQLPTGSIETDFAAKVGMRPDAGDPTGDISAIIGEREPLWKIDPEWQPAIGFNVLERWRAQTLFPVSMLFGTSTGNTLRLYAPKCEITQVADGEREGIWTSEIEVHPRGFIGDGDDEFFYFIY